MRQFILLQLLMFTFQIFSQTSSVRLKQFNLDKGIALQGYDPVAYFLSNKAVKGNKNFSAVYQGVTYYFSTEKNKSTFVKDPIIYEPQYGGWCAFAMGDYNKKVEINPETFKIVNGKLYLFYNAYLNNTLKSWNKNENILMSNADKSWSNFLIK